MKITILDKTNVKYNDHYLTAHQTYNDIDDKTANELIKAGEAKLAADEIAGVSFQSAPMAHKTDAFNVRENGGYVAQAQLTEAQKRELEEKGEATAPDGKKVKKDETPVTGQDKTNPKIEDDKVEVQQKVYGEDGHELTEAEIEAKEKAAQSAAPKDRIPTPAEANKTGDAV